MTSVCLNGAWDRTAQLAVALIKTKMGKGRVKNFGALNGSKECACLTPCTPCKGLRPVDPAPSVQPLARR